MDLPLLQCASQTQPSQVRQQAGLFRVNDLVGAGSESVQIDQIVVWIPVLNLHSPFLLPQKIHYQQLIEMINWWSNCFIAILSIIGSWSHWFWNDSIQHRLRRSIRSIPGWDQNQSSNPINGYQRPLSFQVTCSHDSAPSALIDLLISSYEPFSPCGWTTSTRSVRIVVPRIATRSWVGTQLAKKMCILFYDPYQLCTFHYTMW